MQLLTPFESRQWVIDYFKGCHLNSPVFSKLVELSGAGNILGKAQQAIQIERYLWYMHRDQISNAPDPQAKYCEIVDTYRNLT